MIENIDIRPKGLWVVLLVAPRVLSTVSWPYLRTSSAFTLLSVFYDPEDLAPP